MKTFEQTSNKASSKGSTKASTKASTKTSKQDPNEPDHKPVNLNTADGKMAFIESVLFVSKDPVEPERLMNFLDIDDIVEFDKLISKMDRHYRESDRGVLIQRTGGGLQLTTMPQMHDYLKEFFTVKSSSRLTIASLETLAIIAYRQPVTIAEISDLRGVNSVGPTKNLLQKKLVKITGRKKVPGLPALYSTTKEFLLYFGLNDLSELPSLEELTEMFEDKEQPSLFQ